MLDEEARQRRTEQKAEGDLGRAIPQVLNLGRPRPQWLCILGGQPQWLCILGGHKVALFVVGRAIPQVLNLRRLEEEAYF